MRHRSSHSKPVVVSANNSVFGLQRIYLGKDAEDGGRKEEFIQKLVFDAPETIPMEQIEPAFTPLISVCRELPVPSGSLDNLWVTPDGNIVIGECKLAKNPQARREVLVQALDYASAITKWDYLDFETAIGLARSEPGFKLWDFIAEHMPEELRDDGESTFCDTVQRRLMNGQFAVLLILDGVQAGLETLTQYLQMHAGVHSTVAIVELSVWKLDDGKLLVLPRVPLQTLLVERGIVTVSKDGQIRVKEGLGSANLREQSSSGAYTNSEQEFYEKIEKKVPGIAERLKKFLATIEQYGIVPEYRKSLILRWYPEVGTSGSVGMIDANGIAWLGDGYWSAKKIGKETAGIAYLESVASLISGFAKFPDATNGHAAVQNKNGKVARIDELIEHSDQWADAIRLLTAVSESVEYINESRSAPITRKPIDPRRRIEALARFAPVFRQTGVRFGDIREVRGKGTKNNPMQLPAFAGNSLQSSFIDEMYRAGWVLNFDYMGWWRSSEGARFANDNDAIAKADIDQLSKIMTVMMRGEYWNDGWLEDQLQNGRLLAIASRAEQILKNGEPINGEWQEMV